MTDMGSTPEMIAVHLNAGELLAQTATFLYELSAYNLTGDAEKDLNPEESRALLDTAEALLVRIKVIPDEWNLVERLYRDDNGEE